MSEAPKAVELKGGPIARSNQMFVRLSEIGEIGPNGKKLMSIGFKGMLKADPDKPLSTLAAPIVGELLRIARWSDEAVRDADIARFLQLIDNTFRPPAAVKEGGAK